MRALVRLRETQQSVKARSEGALLRVERGPDGAMVDLASVGADAPLATDFFSLFVLQLMEDFPEQREALAAMAQARRDGLNPGELSVELWEPDGARAFELCAQAYRIDASLLARILWVSLKPLYEAVAEALVRHIDLPQSSGECPVCGGPAWARCDGRLRCSVCETDWQGDLGCPACGAEALRAAPGFSARGAGWRFCGECGFRLRELDESLFAHAFDPAPLIELVRGLDIRPAYRATLKP